MKQYLFLAIPSAFMMALEVWCFSLMTILSSLLGANITAANAIVLNVTGTTVMIPISIGVAAGIRIGNNIGRGDARNAKLACWVSFVIGEIFMVCNGLSLLLLRSILASAFTEDPGVVSIVLKLFPLAALFQIFDGAQVVLSGIIRGIGRQIMGAVCNFMGYYVIGLPVGSLLAFFIQWRETGLWWGLTIGLFVVSVTLFAFLTIFVDWKYECEYATKRLKDQEVDSVNLLSAESDSQEAPTDGIPDIMAEKGDNIEIKKVTVDRI
jgi:MATE family multidrug resistance protein